MATGKYPAPGQGFPCIVVVGCGHWGKNLVRNFSEIGVLAGVCDADPETAAKMAESYDVSAISFEQVLEDSEIDAVAIAAPARQHYALAKKAILAGKDVFVEKPLALLNTEAKELAELADSRERVLMVGHLLQYHPCFLKLPDLISERGLGRIQYIYSNRLNFGKIRTEENALWSFAPHDISMILSLAGEEPIDVSAVGFNCLHDDIADITTMHIRFANGIAGHVHVSWLHPFKEQRLVIVCENGMVVFDDGQDWTSKLSYYPHRVDWDSHVPVAAKGDGVNVAIQPAEPLRNECMHFLECVRDRQTPRTDGWEGVRVLNVLNLADNYLKQQSV